MSIKQMCRRIGRLEQAADIAEQAAEIAEETERGSWPKEAYRRLNELVQRGASRTQEQEVELDELRYKHEPLYRAYKAWEKEC